ncbi:TPA: hypothetical protein ACIBS5_003253 [Salmonella enterica subsp. diarizonae serovar 60-67:z35:-]
MKKMKCLAVAAALSAVMTGSAFATPTAVEGQHLTITTTINTPATSFAEVQSKHITLDNQGKIAAETVLAQISNLPKGAKLVDTGSDTTGQIKFTKVGGAETFQAEAWQNGAHGVVISAGSEGAGTTASDLPLNAVVDVVTVAELSNQAAGVYTSTPVVYTYTE